MLLAIDAGNTNISFGVFDGNKIAKRFNLPSDMNLSYQSYGDMIAENLRGLDVDSCIIASVAGSLDSVLKKTAESDLKIGAIVVSSDLELGFEIKTENPHAVGADRIANAAALRGKYGFPAIAVDIGTATTLDIINSEGNFIGGAILPGLDLQLHSLWKNTSKLPQISIENSCGVIGTNTKDAILSGVVRGHAHALDGLIRECVKELGADTVVVLTGGYAEFISHYMESKFAEVNPNLTLDGLRIIFEKIAG